MYRRPSPEIFADFGDMPPQSPPSQLLPGNLATLFSEASLSTCLLNLEHDSIQPHRWLALLLQLNPKSMSSMEASLETTATLSGAREMLVQTSCLRACEGVPKLQMN